MLKTFTIEVINVNEPPSSLELSTLSVLEGNLESQTVAEIIATDPETGDEDLVKCPDRIFKIAA